MDELPSNAKQLLSLARTAQEPPDAARDRVRKAVTVAIAAGGAGLAGQVANASAQRTVLKAPFLSTVPGKLSLISGAALIVGAGAFATIRTSAAPPRSAARVPAPIVAPLPASVPNAPAAEVEPRAREQLAEPVGPQQRVARVRKPQTTSVGAADESLRAEMVMLHAASAALDSGELENARSLLDQHRGKFEHGQLRDERRGLEALALCLAHDPRAERSARDYLRARPEGVLAARIASACLPRTKP